MHLQNNTIVGLVVMGESGHTRPLLVHRISKENAYQRQGGEHAQGCLPRSLPALLCVSFRSVILAGCRRYCGASRSRRLFLVGAAYRSWRAEIMRGSPLNKSQQQREQQRHHHSRRSCQRQSGASVK